MTDRRPNVFLRLFRGQTSFDFAGRWRWWFALSGAVILAGALSLGVRGLNFSIEFKGGTSWTVPTQTASLSDARDAVGRVSAALRQATIQELTNHQTGRREIEVQAAAKDTANNTEVTQVTQALANMAHVSTSEVTINDVGPSWGSDITNKAIEAIIVFLVLCSLYIWLRFEGKMAVAALTALVHDIVVTAGIYSLSGFQVSPDTVIAFLTILGYSLYDTIVVFDKVQENTKGLASTGRMTYTDTVNLSMNQVLARSINTSFVAILPILSILVIGSWVLHATALNDFGLALLVGLATGAYSSIFIASPLLALLKEREPRYAQIRDRLATRAGLGRRVTPAVAAERHLTDAEGTEAAPAGAGRRATTRVSAGSRDGGRSASQVRRPPRGSGAVPGGSLATDATTAGVGEAGDPADLAGKTASADSPARGVPVAEGDPGGAAPSEGPPPVAPAPPAASEGQSPGPAGGRPGVPPRPRKKRRR